MNEMNMYSMKRKENKICQRFGHVWNDNWIESIQVFLDQTWKFVDMQIKKKKGCTNQIFKFQCISSLTACRSSPREGKSETGVTNYNRERIYNNSI